LSRQNRRCTLTYHRYLFLYTCI